MLNRNGTPPAPRSSTGAGAFSPPRTEFLPDLPADTWQARLYQASRSQLLTFPLLRWIYLLLYMVALLWPLLALPGMWAGSALALAAALALWLVTGNARRRGFVHFAPSTLPPVTAARLPPTHKTPVYVTGWLHVQNKVRHFAGLPGFYRTFATREHALFCLVRPRRWTVLASWPGEEEGLWYAFFQPDQIDNMRAGQVTFGRRSLPALAVAYRPAKVTDGKQGRQPTHATLYLAFVEEAARDTVLADLLIESTSIHQPGESR